MPLRLFSVILILALGACTSDSPGRKLFRSGDYLTSVVENQSFPSLEGTWSGRMTMQAGFNSGPFAEGIFYDLNITRANFTTDTTYDIYQDEPTDPSDPAYDECVQDPSYTRSEYESQSGCNVYKDSVEEKGDVTLVFASPLSLSLGPDVFHNFAKDFSYLGTSYNLRFGDDYSHTDRGDTSAFRVKIVERTILLRDSVGIIQLF